MDINVFKTFILLPSVWLTIFSILSITSIVFKKRLLSRYTLALALISAISTTEAGAYLWLGSLNFITNHSACDTTPKSMILLPAGLSWRENERHTPSDTSLLRLNWAAELSQLNNVTRVYIPGGHPHGNLSEGAILANYLQKTSNSIQFYEIGTISRTTHEDLLNLRPLLDGSTEYYLVTSSWHQPRAQRSAQKLGLYVCPSSPPEKIGLSLVPSYKAQWTSQKAMHEWVGILWYKLSGRL